VLRAWCAKSRACGQPWWVIALGANDGLRGLPPRETRRNLARMIGAAQGVGAKVLLVGMRIPPNYGAEYTRAFENNYRELAQLFDTALLPFMLEPIARDRRRSRPTTCIRWPRRSRCCATMCGGR
jgi:acyl-CoA thioesterase-1